VRPLAIVLAASLGACRTSAPPGDLVHRASAFWAAREAGDLDRARAMQSDDPRTWWEHREGPGEAWTLGEGRWKAWDTHFRGRSAPGPWRVEGMSVTSVVDEINDYYRLTERGPQPYRLTYFFDPDGRISGELIASEPSNSPGSEKEFQAWAVAHEPDEYAYLRPGGRIDPTGDRGPRTRALLERWRKATGRPALAESDAGWPGKR
jgi:hypothetical protein